MRKKKKKIQKLIIITLFMLISSLSLSYAAFNTNININTKGNISKTPETCFTVTDNGNGTGTITDYNVNNCGDKVIIPNKINNLIITKIADGTSTQYENDFINKGPFTDKNIKTVILPDTITYIGAISFFGNKLKKLNIPGSVQTIKWQAFSKNELEEVILNEGIKTIESNAFTTNNLKNIKIPNSVTTLGTGIVTDNLMEGNNAFVYNKNTDGSTNYAYLNSYGNRNSTTITFPENIKKLGQDSLYNLPNLTTLNISSNIEEIEFKFANLPNLKTINIENGIRQINNQAFIKLPNLTTININKKENEITGAPWGIKDATVNWTSTD